jgi:thioredoxin 1
MGTKNLVKFSEQNFESEILSYSGIVIVDFWAEWCAPCIMLTPVIEFLAEQYQGKIKVGKLNVDENPVIASQYGITGIPAVIIFKDGKIVKEMVGFQPKEAYISEIEKLLN